MASKSDNSVELKELLPTAIPELDDTGQNSETQQTTACVQQKPTPSSQTTSKQRGRKTLEPSKSRACVQQQPTPSSQTTSEERGPKNPEPPESSAFYKKTYTSGKIRFIKDNEHICDAKFIKINTDAGDNESILEQVAEGVGNKLWRHCRKNLLLSVTAGADKLDEAGRIAFEEGIKLMLSGTCIVTGGTNDGVARLVGEAVHEFNNYLHYENKCLTIGIVCFDRIRNKDTLKPWELTRGVFGIDSDGELFTVDTRGERWTLNPASLTNVDGQSDGNTTTNEFTDGEHGHSSSNRFAVGDLVQIRSDQETVKPADNHIWEDYLELTLGQIGFIVLVNEDNDLRIRVHGKEFQYKPNAVTLLTRERLFDLLCTNFKTHEPSDGDHELVQAVKHHDVNNVYAIIRQAYKDFNEFTSASLGVDCNYNFYVVDANGDRRTFTPDDITNESTADAIESKAHDIPHDFAPGDLVMILESAKTEIRENMLKTLGKVGTVKAVTEYGQLIITVCGVSYSYLRRNVKSVNRGRFDLLKKHFQTHTPACERDKLQQAVIKDDFEKVTLIIRKAYKDAERTCEYRLTTAIDDLQDKANTERYLDSHSNLFVLVADSTLDEFGGEIKFRANLEKRISSEMIRSKMKGEIYENRSVLQFPLVNLVLNNDQYTLETVKSAMDEGIPSVVVITTDLDTHKRQDSAISDGKNEIKTKMLRNSNIPNDAIKTFQETYKKKLRLLAVIKLSDMFEMLAEMTLDVWWEACSVKTSLLEWALNDRDKSVVVKRLVCADCNRTFYNGMNGDAIAFTMNYFLIHNDEEVVRALVQLNVNLGPTSIKDGQYIELCNVENGLLKLKTKDIPMVSLVMQRVQARPVRGRLYGYKDAWLPATYSSEEQIRSYMMQINNENLLQYWEYMFIWTLLMRKHEMAKIVWTKTEHPLFMALIARNLFEAVKQKTDDKILIAEINNMMSEWSTVAIDCLNECYQNGDEATYVHLTMTMPFWYAKSCLDLAVESKNMEFLAQQACRNLVGDVWDGQRMDDTLEKVRESSSATDTYMSKFFSNKIQAPKTKFAFNVISYLVFLSLFACVLLFDLTNDVSTKEFVLFTWVLAILVEEIRQMHQIYQIPSCDKASSCVQRIRKKMKNYFSEGWNCIDMFTIVIFLLGFGLRFKQSQITFDLPRVVLAVDFVAFVFRLVYIFSVQKTLGPKLIIILRMVQDLLYFMVIMAVFVLAYAIASHSILYPGAQVSWETARQIIRKPYWHLYGELFLDKIEEDPTDCTNDASLWTNGTERCPSETGKIVIPFMMGVYLLFSNILLLNLLIAMFSYTFTTIHEQSDKIWCFQRYFIIKDYALRPVLCPPLNVFWHIYQLFQCCLHKCKRSQAYDDPFHIPYEKYKKYGQKLRSFMNGAVQTYACNRKRNEEENNDSRIKAANDKLDHLAEKQEDFMQKALESFEALKRKVDELEKKVKQDDEFQNTMLIQIKQAAEKEDEFRRLMLNEFRQMQASIAPLKKQ